MKLPESVLGDMLRAEKPAELTGTTCRARSGSVSTVSTSLCLQVQEMNRTLTDQLGPVSLEPEGQQGHINP